MIACSLSLYIYIYILISAYCWISRLFLFSPLNRSTILPFPFSLSFSYSLSSSFSVPSLPHLASYPRVRMASPSIWGSRLARERGATWRPLWGAPRGCGSRGVGVTHGGLGGSVPREFCPHFWFIPSYELNGFVLSRSSHVWLFATLVDYSCQAPLSMGFSRQEYWSGLPCPPPGDLPNPGIEPESPALQLNSLLLSHWGS